MDKHNTLFHGFDTLVPIVTVEFFFTDENGEPNKDEKGLTKAPTSIHIHQNLAEAQAAVDHYNNLVRGRHQSVCKIGNSFNMSLRDIMGKCQGYTLVGSDITYYVLK